MNEYKQISVYDKDQKLIAEFTNTAFPQSDTKLQNKTYTPIVRIVQNGESTLSFSMFKNSEKWKAVKDPENIWVCDGREYTALNDGSIVYDGELVNVSLVETWYLLDKDYAQIHNVDTTVESLDEHTVKILPKSPTTNKLTINGIQYEDSQVMDSRGILQPRGSAGYALWAILRANKMGWSMGICDVIVDGFNPANDYGIFNLESDMKDLLHNIQYIQELWGGVLVWDSVNKTVSLRDETKVGSDFNTWKGVEFKRGKNLLSEPQITQDNTIITKAYILGNSNLNIKAVNNDKTYVEDYSYTDKVYEGYLQNSNIYYTGDESTSGQTQLLEWGKREISKYCKPRIQYALDVLDRRFEQGFEHEIFGINDIVHVIIENPDTGTEKIIERRIIEWQYNVFDPSDSTVTIGDKIVNFEELFNLTYKNSVTEVPKFDWNGNYSGDDIIIEIPDYLSDYYGGGYGGGYGTLNDINTLNAEISIKSEADIYKYADDTYATIVAFTDFSVQTAEKFEESYTQIAQVSDELHAQIDLEANHYLETKDLISEADARITLLANDTQAQITIQAQRITQNTNEIDNANSNIASITLTVNDQGSRIDLVADEIYATNLKVDNLEVNMATIDYVDNSIANITYLSVDSLYLNHRPINAYENIYYVSSVSYETNHWGYVTSVDYGTEHLRPVTWEYDIN